MENKMDMEKIDTALTSLINGVKNKLAEENNLCACYESSLTLWRLCDKVDIPYIGFNINEVLAKRMINADCTGRGAISELLITNYEET